jgi:hypothetical protein
MSLHSNIITGEGMTRDEIIEMARQVIDLDTDKRGRNTFLCDEYGLEAFAKLVAQHEREACAYWAGIALLGADRGLSNRVDQAIRARGQA